MPNTTINFTFANLTTGRITATPTQAFATDTNALVIAGKPFASATISSGAATLVLPATESIGVAYDFLVEEGTSPSFVLVDKFRRIVPNASPINAGGLVTAFFSQDALDQSVDAVARRLTIEPYITALSQRIPGFEYKPYTAGTVFAKNQFTARGDSLYRYISATQSSNKDPLIAANVTPSAGAVWELVLKAPTGAGTTTTDVAYDRTAFSSRTTEPASRANLVQAIDTVAQPNLSNYARKDVDNAWASPQTFTANIQVPTQARGNNSFLAASTAFVADAIATSAVTGQQLLVRANRFNMGDLAIASGGVVNVTYSNFTSNVNNWHSGTSFRVPTGQDGEYEWEVGLDLGYNVQTLNTAFRAVLREFTGTDPEVNFNDVILILAAQPYDFGQVGGIFRFAYPCVGGRNYCVRVSTNSAGSASRSVRGNSYNRLNIWKR